MKIGEDQKWTLTDFEEEFEHMKLKNLFEKYCKILSVEQKHLRYKGKERYYSDLRAVFCFIAKEQVPTAILQQIGDIIDRTHASVLHGIKKVNNIKELSKKAEIIKIML